MIDSEPEVRTRAKAIALERLMFWMAFVLGPVLFVLWVFVFPVRSARAVVLLRRIPELLSIV